MTDLRSRVLHIIVITGIALLFSCATGLKYERLSWHDRGLEVLASPDRILLECQKVSDENDLHGFMIHVLDDQNKVVDFIQGGTLSREDCSSAVNEINKVLTDAKRIYIGGVTDPAADPQLDDELFTFPNLGRFPSSKVCVQFIVLKNERGECYDANVGPGFGDDCRKAGRDFLINSKPSGY